MLRVTAASLLLLVGCSTTPEPSTVDALITMKMCERGSEECVSVTTYIEGVEPDEPYRAEAMLCDLPPEGLIVPPEERYKKDCVHVEASIHRERVPMGTRVGNVVIGVAKFIGTLIGAVLKVLPI